MVGSLVQSAVLPALQGNRAQWRCSTKTYAPARVSMSKLQVHSCPLRSSGSRVPHTFFLGAGSILPGQTMRPVRKQARGVAVKAMFDTFTEQAIKVVMLAQEEARRLGHNFVGTEQILLGLIGEGRGIAAQVLKSMGMNLKDARVEVEKIIGRGSGFLSVEIPFTPRAKRVLVLSMTEALQLAQVLKSMGMNLKDARVEVEKIIGRGSGFLSVEIPFTPRAKRVLVLAMTEALQLGHNYLGSEHLLLGLLREEEGVAARVLETLGPDRSNIRNQVTRMIWESTGAVGAGVGGGSRWQKMPTLEEYGTNVTKLAEEGKLDPVVGRQEQIKRVIQNLWRGAKNNPFEKFTEKAIKVVMLAQEEARWLGYNIVGTEQILLGLIGEGTGIAAEVLKYMGMNLKDARVEVEKIIGRGSELVSDEISFTPRAKRVLELSLREAYQLGHNYIGSEHLLLGLLQEEGGVAARVLETLVANPSIICTWVTLMALESTETG